MAGNEKSPAVLTHETQRSELVVDARERLVVVQAPRVEPVLVPASALELVALNRPAPVYEPVYPAAMLLAAGAQGPEGVPGPPGQAGTQLYEGLAAESLSGHRAVYLADDGIRYADASDTLNADATLGITAGAALAGAAVFVVTHGVMVEGSWNWTPRDPVYLGAGGALTQTPPATGLVLVVAIALTATSIEVRIQQPIFL